jgi:hypothetical protein
MTRIQLSSFSHVICWSCSNVLANNAAAILSPSLCHVTMKMATIMSTEMELLQHTTWLNPESWSYPKDVSSRWPIASLYYWTEISVDFLFEMVSLFQSTAL